MIDRGERLIAKSIPNGFPELGRPKEIRPSLRAKREKENRMPAKLTAAEFARLAKGATAGNYFQGERPRVKTAAEELAEMLERENPKPATRTRARVPGPGEDVPEPVAAVPGPQTAADRLAADCLSHRIYTPPESRARVDSPAVRTATDSSAGLAALGRRQAARKRQWQKS